MTENSRSLIARIVIHLNGEPSEATVEEIASALKVNPEAIQDEMDKYPYIGQREPLTSWNEGKVRLTYLYPGSWSDEYNKYIVISDWLKRNPKGATPSTISAKCEIEPGKVLPVLYNNPDTFKLHSRYSLPGEYFTYIPKEKERTIEFHATDGPKFEPYVTSPSAYYGSEVLGERSNPTRVGKENPRPVSYLTEMGERVAEVNDANGWFDETRTFGEDMALLASEVSEAFEAYRSDGLRSSMSEKGKPEGVPSELADVLIRLLDTCYRYGIDLEAEFNVKLAYNSTRSYRHGGKLL